MATHIVCLELIYDGSLNTVVIPIVYKSALLAMGSPMQASTVQPVADGELAIHVGDSIRFPGYKAATLIFDDGTQQILTAAELAACKVKP